MQIKSNLSLSKRALLFRRNSWLYKKKKAMAVEPQEYAWAVLVTQGWNFPLYHYDTILMNPLNSFFFKKKMNPVSYYDKQSITKPSCLQGSINLGKTCGKQQKIMGGFPCWLGKWSLTWAHESMLQRLHAVAGLWPMRSYALSAICMYRTVIPHYLLGKKML